MSVSNHPLKHLKLNIYFIPPPQFIPRLVGPDNNPNQSVALRLQLAGQRKLLKLWKSVDHRKYPRDEVIHFLVQRQFARSFQNRFPEYRLQTVTGEPGTTMRAHVPRPEERMDRAGARLGAIAPVAACP